MPFPADEQNPTAGSVSAGILEPDEKAKLSFTGLVFSPDGSRIYLANVNGDIKVFGVGQDHKVIAAVFHSAAAGQRAAAHRRKFPPASPFRRTAKDFTSRSIFPTASLELDAATGKVLRTWDVGVAPFDVVLCRQQSLREQLGRAAAGRGQRHRPGGRRHAGARGCALHRQRRLGVGD